MLIEHLENGFKAVIGVHLLKMPGLFIQKKCQLYHTKSCHQHERIALCFSKIHTRGPKGWTQENEITSYLLKVFF